jgi:hypothetical protein
VCACGNEPVDIGDDAVGSELSDYAARWDGYAEAYRFDSDSDAIRVRLDENGNGVFQVGTAAPLAPPTDPTVGYPPAYADKAEQAPGGLYSGFSYTIEGAVVENSRLRLSVNPNEVFTTWCDLQTPVRDDFNSTPEEEYYNCIPNAAIGDDEEGCWIQPEGSGVERIDCQRLRICRYDGVCECTADGCRAKPVPASAYSVNLDARLESNGDVLEGTLLLTYLGEERVTVRMTRN